MKKYKNLFIGIILIILLFYLCIVVKNNIEKKGSIITNSNISVSNNKIGWGLKREKDHRQPNLGNQNKRLIEKYNGIAMGNDADKYIYLTFDLGYEAGYTENILNTLKDNNVKAAFFITAHYVNTASNLVKRMIDEGDIVGNHTVNHKSLPDLNNEEIKNELMNLHTVVYEKFRI